MEYGYNVIFEPMPEGGYHVIVPAMPEICTDGDTLDKAREMAKDAIKLVLESSRELGEPLPPVDAELATTERVAVTLP